jgi:hypothetical protein
MVDGMWCSFERRQRRKRATAKSLVERFERLWRYELSRGPSRSKDALRMTAKTNNGEKMQQQKKKQIPFGNDKQNERQTNKLG